MKGNQEITTEAEAQQGMRVMVTTARDDADDLVIEVRVRRRENTALYDEPPCYEPTGNIACNGQIADLLNASLLPALNSQRHRTRLG